VKNRLANLFFKKEPKAIQSASFKTAVQDVIKSKDGGSVHISRVDPDGGSGLAGNFISKGDVRDFDDVDIEPYIKSRYGGGTFNVTVTKMEDDKAEHLYASFRFHIEGDPLESRTEASRKNKSVQEINANITDKLLDKALDGNNGKNDAVLAIIQSNQTAMQGLFAQIVDIQSKNTDTILRIMESHKDGNNPVFEALEGILKLNEVKEMLSPSVHEDKTLEWARLASDSPIISALAGKFLGLEIPQSSVLPLAEAKPPGEQPALASRPKETPSSQSLQADHTGGGNILRNGRPTDRGDFERAMLDPLISLIDNGGSPTDIATFLSQIINMTLSTMRVGVEPHPIMINFINSISEMLKGNADFELLNRAYEGFTMEIEMPPVLVEPVRAELIKIYTPMFMQMKKAPPVSHSGQAPEREERDPNEEKTEEQSGG